MTRYYIANITTCFPFQARQRVNEENWGVFAKYYGQNMIEAEIDNVICEIIKKHPFIENAMWLEFHIEWLDDKYISIYHNIMIRNNNYPRESKEYSISPIQWR